MKIHLLEREQILPIGIDEAWEFFSSPSNLDAITPPDLGFKITSRSEGAMYEGQLITYSVRVAPAVWVSWVTEIKAVEPRRAFVDEQRFGPYRFWHHRHLFEETPEGVRMSDRVHYALPFPPFGEIGHGWFVRPKLERIFDFRKQELARRFGAVPGRVGSAS